MQKITAVASKFNRVGDQIEGASHTSYTSQLLLDCPRNICTTQKKCLQWSGIMVGPTRDIDALVLNQKTSCLQILPHWSRADFCTVLLH